jgi:hypothetical protein
VVVGDVPDDVIALITPFPTVVNVTVRSFAGDVPVYLEDLKNVPGMTTTSP